MYNIIEATFFNKAVIDIYTVYIYNNESSRLERYRLDSYRDMPYTSFGSMGVTEFFGNTISHIGWTSSDFLRAWSSFSAGRIRATNVFRRISEGGHIFQSMHYAGLAADHNSDKLSTAFSFAEDSHVAIAPAGYPELYPQSIGPLVFVMQDALNTLGFCECELDGFFGTKTLHELRRFKSSFALSSDDVCDHTTWCKLFQLAAGIGITPTVRGITRHNKIFCSLHSPK